MINDVIRAILAHHQEEVAALNKVISDRNTEIAQIVQELDRQRTENAQLRAQRGMREVSVDRGVLIEGKRAKVEKGKT